MARVRYVGRADKRKIGRQALKRVGFSVSSDLVWERSNGFAVEVNDSALVAYLLAIGGFEADGVDFAEAFTAGRSASAVEGMPTVAYGNSWIGADYMNTVGARWTNRISQRLNLGGHTNRHINGSTVWDIARAMIGTTSTPAVNMKGIVLIGGGGVAEQLLSTFDPSTNPILEETIKQCVRSSIIAASGSFRTESSFSGVTVTGNWQTANQNMFSSGSYRLSSVEGATLTYPVTSEGLEGTYDVFIPSIDTTGTFGRREAIVSVGGDERERVSPVMSKRIDGNDAPEMGFFAVTVPDVEIGDQISIAVGVRTSTNASLPTAGVDFIQRRNSTPPLIVLLLPVNIGLIPDAEVEITRRAMRSAASEFDHVLVVDPKDGWDHRTMLGDDLVHKNDRGQAHIADHVARALSSVGFRDGLNTLTVPAS